MNDRVEITLLHPYVAYSADMECPNTSREETLTTDDDDDDNNDDDDDDNDDAVDAAIN